MNEKWQILDKNFEPRTNQEYDIFISTLITEGLYIFANINKEIEFDDYGIAAFKGFEEIFSDEKGTYGIIYKK